MSTMDLFAHGRKAQLERESPLANRMRPRSLEEFVGQEHIVGPGRLLRRAIQADQLSSLIFYGPPGTGKTTLARVIANSTESHFITINAVLAGVQQIREAISVAQERWQLYGQRTTLFVDEVHRWNKAQQDALLPHVENGTIILIGATTENPYFEVNKALVSRSRIFQLKLLTIENLRQIARQALSDPDRGYGRLNINIDDDALEHLVDVANGDARGVLNALELAVETTEADEDGIITIDLAVAEESIQRRAVLYDKEGDVHYDTISAFIKSLRGSDADAALYWMARMVYAGEDPRFIFRRMTIFAGEDVGMADPQAMGVVTSCWEAFERVGMPEGRFPLAQAAIYLATAPKSNSAFAFFDALTTVESEQETEVPNHLRDGNRDSEGFGHGRGYLYPHAYRDHWVAQQYLPDSLQGKVFYQPGDLGYERRIRVEVDRRREAQLAAMVEGDVESPLEILSSSPQNKAQEAWLNRAVASSGRRLQHIRERLFELAPIRRHHVVLNLNAGSGLLTWEAVRRTPEGGVWALAAEAENGAALRQIAERLPDVERPVILIGDITDLDYLLELRNDNDIRFDHIIGRNVFNLRTAEVPELVPLIAGRLFPNGQFTFVQLLPRYSQRLYSLVDWSGREDLREKVSALEEEIYSDPADPLVNWDESDLKNALEADDIFEVEVVVEKRPDQRLINSSQLDRWLNLEPIENMRPSYLMRLRNGGLPDKALSEIAALYRRSLLDRDVAWQTANAFLTGRLRGG
jgi:putative ATPase